MAGDSIPFAGGSIDCMVLKIDSNGEIPGCNLMRPAALSASTPAVKVQDTAAAVVQTSAIINSAILLSRDTLSPLSALCCYDPDDFDCDTILNPFDNCPETPNSPALGTCIQGTIGGVCVNSSTCGYGGACSMNQEDMFPSPGGNSIGDACECEGDFDCDGDVDGTNISAFKRDFGRNQFHLMCSGENPCQGDFGCDNDVDGSDAVLIKADFGRGFYRNPCPSCIVGVWCNY